MVDYGTGTFDIQLRGLVSTTSTGSARTCSRGIPWTGAVKVGELDAQGSPIST